MAHVFFSMEYTKPILEWDFVGVRPPVTTISFADATAVKDASAYFGPGPASLSKVFSFKSKAASGSFFLTKNNLSKPHR